MKAVTIVKFATLSENSSPTVRFSKQIVRGQISEHIFSPNGGYCLYHTVSKCKPISHMVTQCIQGLDEIPSISFPVVAWAVQYT